MQMVITSDRLLAVEIGHVKRSTSWGGMDNAQRGQGEYSDLRVDIGQILAHPDFLQQKRPKGKFFQLELPPETDGMPFVSLVMGSNSMGRGRGVVESRSTEPKSGKDSNRGVRRLSCFEAWGSHGRAV